MTSQNWSVATKMSLGV